QNPHNPRVPKPCASPLLVMRRRKRPITKHDSKVWNRVPYEFVNGLHIRNESGRVSSGSTRIHREIRGGTSVAELMRRSTRNHEEPWRFLEKPGRSSDSTSDRAPSKQSK